jgi:intron-binding protein aquarius
MVAATPAQLTVAQLKVALGDLGLDVSGLKGALVARLKEALAADPPDAAAGAAAPAEAEEEAVAATPASTAKTPKKPAQSPAAPAAAAAAAPKPSPAPASKGRTPAKATPKTPAAAPAPEAEAMETDAAEGEEEEKESDDEEGEEEEAAAPAEGAKDADAKQPPGKRAKGEGKDAGGGKGGKGKGGKERTEKGSKDKRKNQGDKPRSGPLTVTGIQTDPLMKTAARVWQRNEGEAASVWDEAVCADIYATELGGGARPPSLKRVQLLEISQYLEQYLWPHFDEGTSSATHVLSIMMMVNEKFRESVAAWTPFHNHAPEKFAAFFKRVMALKTERELTTSEKTAHLVFLIHVFQSLEDEMVRAVALPLVSLPLWAGAYTRSLLSST